MGYKKKGGIEIQFHLFIRSKGKKIISFPPEPQELLL